MKHAALFGRTLLISLFALTSFSTTAFSQNLRRSTDATVGSTLETGGIEAGRIATATAGTGVAAVAGVYGYGQYRQAADRRNLQKTVLHDSSRPPENIKFISHALAGTSYGDVIRFEYSLLSANALKIALPEILKSVDTWTQRVSELKQALQILEEKRAAVDMNARSGPALSAKLQAEAAEIGGILKDSEVRLQNAKKVATDAITKDRVYRMTGRFQQPLRVKRDILITEQTAAEAQSAFARYFGPQDAKNPDVKNAKARAVLGFSNVKIERVQFPSSSIVARSMNHVRAAGVAFGVGLAVAIEEILAGWIADQIEQGLENHFVPQMETGK